MEVYLGLVLMLARMTVHSSSLPGTGDGIKKKKSCFFDIFIGKRNLKHRYIFADLVSCVLPRFEFYMLYSYFQLDSRLQMLGNIANTIKKIWDRQCFFLSILCTPRLKITERNKCLVVRLSLKNLYFSLISGKKVQVGSPIKVFSLFFF